MSIRRLAALLPLAALSLLLTSPANALSMKECSSKFKAAREAGTLDGMKWTEFRKIECGAAPTEDSAKSEPAKSTGSTEGMTFPDAIDPKFGDESPAKQRMKTCLESYHANKKAKTLNGMRWVQKGGGYYSQCNARLQKAKS
ncbi:MAG: hypothetical protein KF874_08135 [Rhizobiaceae bacterium]|nr:hypothetical protein [Rhizobiaceae bacterium]